MQLNANMRLNVKMIFNHDGTWLLTDMEGYTILEHLPNCKRCNLLFPNLDKEKENVYIMIPARKVK